MNVQEAFSGSEQNIHRKETKDDGLNCSKWRLLCNQFE